MSSYAQRLRVLYIFAFGTVALLTIVGHLRLASLEGIIADDGALVRVAGRQSTLSQEIASLSLRIQDSHSQGNAGAADAAGNNLETALETWTEAHRDLVDRPEASGLGGRNPPEISAALAALEGPMNAIAALSRQLIETTGSSQTSPDDASARALAGQIVDGTDRFLPAMRGIVGLYEADLSRHVESLKTAERWTLAITLTVLLGQALFVMEPALRRLLRQQSDLAALRAALDEHTLFSVTDTEGRIVDVNEGFCRINGYTRDELIGQDHRILNSGHHPSEFWANMWATIAAGKPWREDVCNRARNGSYYWANSTNVPQFDASGKIERYISLRFDVTEQKSSEKAVQKANRELESVLAAATRLSIIATDPDGTITMFNAGAERLLGYKAREVVGKQTPEFLHVQSELAEQGRLLSEKYDREIRGFEIFALPARQEKDDEKEWTYVRKDGSEFVVNLSLSAIRDSEDRLTGYLCVAYDVTDELAAERKLEEQRAELQAIIDAIPGFVFYKDNENRILDCNKAAAGSIGLPKDEIRNRSADDFFPSEVASAQRRDDLEVIESGQPQLGVMEQYEAKESERLHVRTDRIPLRGPAGTYDRLVAIATDITDTVRATEQIKEAEERLDMALSASGTGLWDWEIKSGDTYFNDTWYTMLGYEPGELPMHIDTCHEICHPEDADSVARDLENHFSGYTDTYTNEHRVRCRDGSWLWVRDVGRVVQKAADGSPQRMVGVHINIQALQDAVTRAESTNFELQETQQRFELALEGSRDAIFDWNLVTDRIYFSPRWQDLLKLPENEIAPKLATLTDRIAKDDAPRVERELADFVRGGDAHFDSEFQVTTDSGERVWVLMRAASFRTRNGRATRVAGSVADITSLKEAEQEMRRLVQQDHLTGLASRSRLVDRLEHAVARSRRNGTHCGVLFFDFDRFKVVNDSLGHDVGDELLCSIAERLRSNLRQVDTPARFGGDEFVILLEDLPDTEAARVVADKLLGICAEPHAIRGHNLVSTASIGLVTSELATGGPADLLRYADAAMYEAKRNGRCCVVEFDKDMYELQHERAELEEDLNAALSDEQLTLHFQPIVDLESGHIVSAEALLRWNHPSKGAISPSVFIPIAEESREIVAIGEWVIAETCRQLASWRERGVVADDFALSINVSKMQILSPGFPQTLVGYIDASGLPRTSIKVEVTETTIVDNRADIGSVLEELRAQSIVIMMDDFGTGHSSLSGLHKLPIDELKIDQSFIRHADSNRELIAITSSIVSLADHLTLRTIGEGIETSDHVALLQSMGCILGQGYYWSRPVPADELETFIYENSPSARSRPKALTGQTDGARSLRPER